MRRYVGLLFAAATALTALSGCDDRNAAKQSTRNDKAANPATSGQSGRFGVGWHAVADGRISVWTFAPRAVVRGGMLATQSDMPVMRAPETVSSDGLTAIRAALMTNMLPARSSVRIEELVSRAAASIASSGSDPSVPRARAVLATSPWNDDTLLLWVEIPGQAAADGTGISVEFDPRAVSAFRILGDPSAVPGPVRAADGGAVPVAMIYELSPAPVGRAGTAKANLQFGVLHIAASGGAPQLDQPITAADAVGTIDNAPDNVRLAAAAAGFGELLRGDPAVRDLSCNDVIALAQSVRRPDPDGWRARLIALMYRAQPLIDLPPAESTR